MKKIKNICTVLIFEIIFDCSMVFADSYVEVKPYEKRNGILINLLLVAIIVGVAIFLIKKFYKKNDEIENEKENKKINKKVKK